MSKLPIWNVTASVVDLIAAPTGQAAQAALIDRLQAAGFTLYDDSENPGSPFESEPLDPELEKTVRAESPYKDGDPEPEVYGKYAVKVDGEEIDHADTRAEAKRHRDAVIYGGIGTEAKTTIEPRSGK